MTNVPNEPLLPYWLVTGRPMQPNPTYSPKKLADACGVSKKCVYGWIRTGRVAAITTPSGRLLISEPEFSRVKRQFGVEAA